MEFRRGRLGIPGIAAAYGYHATGLRPGLHRGLPSQFATFIISLDDPIETAASAEELTSGATARNGVVVSGVQTKPAFVRQPEHQAGIQLSVHPLLSRKLFGAPLSELSDLTYEGADVFGRSIEALREQLYEQKSWEQRFATVGAYVRRRLTNAHHEPRRELLSAWQLLRVSAGNLTGTQLSEAVGYTQRHLTELFRREVGLTPKDVARLMRFDRTVSLVSERTRAGVPVVFAEIAAECGFFDQAHLVREFRQFTETTPTAWIGEEFQNLQAGGHDRREESSV